MNTMRYVIPNGSIDYWSCGCAGSVIESALAATVTGDDSSCKLLSTAVCVQYSPCLVSLYTSVLYIAAF